MPSGIPRSWEIPFKGRSERLAAMDMLMGIDVRRIDMHELAEDRTLILSLRLRRYAFGC